MVIVKLSTNYAEPLVRQTPFSSGSWGDCRFVINQMVERCDAWVVHEGVSQVESALCPPQNTVLITGEPPAAKRYHPKFLAQFGLIITCHTHLRHPRVAHRQPAIPWHLGVVRSPAALGTVPPYTMTYDSLRMLTSVPKEKLLSVVCSDMRFLPGHRQRIVFVKKLKRYFGARLAHFGRGFHSVPDKAEAILPYRYHIVLENSSVRSYWTEKLADAYLGWAYPFYYGCPNLADDFPVEAFTRIDIHDPDDAIARIEAAIDADYHAKRREAVAHARSLVLEKHNLFAVADELCRAMPSGSLETVTILPESHFRQGDSMLRRAIDRAWWRVPLRRPRSDLR